ncbi:hypothetical protein ADEAN_000098400 [Angomonas deanei]|uniref:Uncharacterized protein n=1 Tax=Angomonas deanei TaxID=59799 RepID=A0A7G2C328_9TRYP|nr:hypothetical protein ADEAN_000098400 [Angomonas deanei]
MFQAIVEKNNRMSVNTWTERIISIPIKGAHLIYCSRKDDPELLTHHKMHVQSILLWPNLPPEAVGKRLSEADVKLVIGIRGTELEVVPADEQRVRNMPAPPLPEEPKKGTFEANETWRIKFADFETLRKAVLYIRRVEDDSEGETPVALKGSLEVLEKAINGGHSTP